MLSLALSDRKKTYAAFCSAQSAPQKKFSKSLRTSSIWRQDIAGPNHNQIYRKGDQHMKRFLRTEMIILCFTLLFVWSMPASAANLTTIPAPYAHEAEKSNEQLFIGEVWKRTELYFGSEQPDGEVVTEAEFQQFVDEEVTPRFPDGLTLLTGYGQFRNSTGAIVKERSMVLILLYPLTMSDANTNLEKIREAYKDAFEQESVLRIDSFSLISF
jgi:hypothetical protein